MITWVTLRRWLEAAALFSEAIWLGIIGLVALHMVLGVVAKAIWSVL